MPDTKHADLLAEGHIFEALTFGGNVEQMVLDAAHGPSHHQNANKFAAKHGIKLVVVAPVA